MKISNVLKPENIILDVTATTKAELIDELSQKLNDNGYLSDIEQFKKISGHVKNRFLQKWDLE